MANQADDWARKLHGEIRGRVLRRVLRTDSRTAELYARAARGIRRRLRATQFTDAEVAAIVREELEAVEEALLPYVEADIREAANSGDEAAARTLRLIEGDTRPFASSPRLRLAPPPRGGSPKRRSEGD